MLRQKGIPTRLLFLLRRSFGLFRVCVFQHTMHTQCCHARLLYCKSKVPNSLEIERNQKSNRKILPAKFKCEALKEEGTIDQSGHTIDSSKTQTSVASSILVSLLVSPRRPSPPAPLQRPPLRPAVPMLRRPADWHCSRPGRCSLRWLRWVLPWEVIQ